MNVCKPQTQTEAETNLRH